MYKYIANEAATINNKASAKAVKNGVHGLSYQQVSLDRFD
jgi:hypothetical protein